jgi:hypothetical protein
MEQHRLQQPVGRAVLGAVLVFVQEQIRLARELQIRDTLAALLIARILLLLPHQAAAVRVLLAVTDNLVLERAATV